MKPAPFVWLDGAFVRADRAAIAPADPAVLYGLGLFEVTRAYDGVPFRLRDHLARMRRSAKHFGLKLRATDAAIDPAVRALCRKNRAPSAYVRITLTGGGRLFVLARPLDPLPDAWYRRGASIGLAGWKRDPAAPLYGHKTLNYLENVSTRGKALESGQADALFLSPEGDLLECCVSNIFVVERGTLVTPSTAQHILPGVTRKVVLELAAELGIPAVERAVSLAELERAEEAFITNALIEILPVVRAGGRPVGPERVGLLTRRLAEAYRRRVESERRSRA